VTRNDVMDRLHAMGIPTRRGVMASHLEPPYLGIGTGLPHTERLPATTLQLPIHPALSPVQQDRVLAALEAVVEDAKE
jgi:dTDP-4-amino-4,6-dideoxygalactose transaminase